MNLGFIDLFIGEETIHCPIALEQVIETSLALYVVVLKIEHENLRIIPRCAAAVDIRLNQAAFDHPVDLTVELIGVRIETVQNVLPHMNGFFVLIAHGVLFDVFLGHFAVFALNLDRRVLSATIESQPALARNIVGDVLDCLDRVTKREVLVDVVVLDHLEHNRASTHLDEVGVLAHIRVANNYMKPAVLLSICMGLISGIDDRAIICRRS